MSVMIVSSESLSKMCKVLKEAYYKSSRSPFFNPMEVLNPSAPRACAMDYTPDKDVEHFVEQCAKWNVKAYHLRYDENHEEARKVKAEKFNRNYRHDATLAQALKTMMCIQYNSDITDYLTQEEQDGDYKDMIDEWRPWYDALSRLCDNAAYAVAESTPEYEQAQWG